MQKCGDMGLESILPRRVSLNHRGELPEFHNVPGCLEVFNMDQRIERYVAMMAHHRPARGIYR